MSSIQSGKIQHETITAQCGRELWSAAQEIERLRTENEHMRTENESLQAEVDSLHNCILRYAPSDFHGWSFGNGGEALAILLKQLHTEKAELHEEFARIFTESIALIERTFRQLAR